MINEAAVIEQHLEAAALRMLNKRRRRYDLKAAKMVVRDLLRESGFESFKLGETHDAVIAAYFDGHARFERVGHVEWEIRRPA